jgi:type III secretion system low calcium response chaperone LcrH/SycD
MKGSRATRSQIKAQTFSEAQKNEAIKKAEESLTNMTAKMMKQGMIPKDAMGLSSQVLEGIYAQAYRLYNTGKYPEAAHLFRTLIVMDPTQSKYVLGLGACFHMLKEYRNAIYTYTMSSIIEGQSPLPYYHSSDCFIQMKDYPSAIVSLKMAIKYAGEKPEFAKLKERAQLSLDSIVRQIESGPPGS